MASGAAEVTTLDRKNHGKTARWLIVFPLLTAAIAFGWILYFELVRLYGMTASAWDVAINQHVIWNVSTGQGFYTSFQRANFLGIHFELIFVVLAAVEKLWADPVVTMVFSAAGLAATAPAAYLFFRAMLPADRAESSWLAMALSAPVPFWAAIQEPARDFFHPENLALPMALLSAWAGIRGHRIAMWVLCVLVLTCKEDQVYTVGVIGLLMAGYGAPSVKKHWRFIVYLAGGWFLIVFGVIQQRIRNGGYSDFVYYRWLVGLDPSLPASVTTVLQALIRPEALLILAVIVAGMAALPLLAPRWLLLAIPPYLADVLSGHTPQNILHLHYVLILMFPLMVAGAVGARRFLEMRSIRPAVAAAAIVPALVLSWGTGRLPPMLLSDPTYYTWPNTLAELRTATRMIPPTAPVSADNGLAVWLANRHTINDFPDRLCDACYIVIDHRPYISGPVDPIKRQATLDALPSSGRHVLYEDGRFQVWGPVGP